ncbi:NUDIX domain-containing protein [Lysinibacillus xylanilyticus]
MGAEFPGGAMEYEESLEETAIRELYERSSLVEECCLTCCSTIGLHC